MPPLPFRWPRQSPRRFPDPLSPPEGGTNRIRVLHLVQNLEIGGMEKMVVELVTHMDQERFDPSVCCYDSLGPLHARLRSKGVPTYLQPRQPGKDWRYPWRLARLLRREGIQVLHMHNPTSLDYGIPAAVIARVPLRIYTEHGRDFSASRPELWIERRAAARLDYCVILHDRARPFVQKQLHIPAQRIAKIYNGIVWSDLDRDRGGSVLRASLGLPPGRKIIAVVGRLAEVKNPMLALESARILFQMDEEPILLFVGDGPLRPELERRCRELEIDHRAFFLGTRNDVPQILKIVDLIWSLSHSEGLSLTLIEASAAGLPAIGTDVGGNAEIIESGVNGFLVPPSDAHAFAETTARILHNPRRLKEMGLAGSARFQRHFRLEQMVHTYEDLYSRLPWTDSPVRQ